MVSNPTIFGEEDVHYRVPKPPSPHVIVRLLFCLFQTTLFPLVLECLSCKRNNLSPFRPALHRVPLNLGQAFVVIDTGPMTNSIVTPGADLQVRGRGITFFAFTYSSRTIMNQFVKRLENSAESSVVLLTWLAFVLWTNHLSIRLLRWAAGQV